MHPVSVHLYAYLSSLPRNHWQMKFSRSNNHLTLFIADRSRPIDILQHLSIYDVQWEKWQNNWTIWTSSVENSQRIWYDLRALLRR